MDKVILLGAGGHCKAVIDILRNSCEIAGITDTDQYKHGKMFHGYQVLGDDSILKSLYSSGIKKALVTLGSVGDSSAREKLFYRAKKIGFEMFNAVSDNAVLSGSIKMGEGNIIMDGSIIHADTIIMNNTIINTGSIIEHDCVIEDHVHISPGACLGGGVRIMEGTHVGLGACVIQDITVGRNCIIGAGAVVINDIPGNCVAVGVPARVIRKQ
jgi:sugar O-acyltransferase (sialic acid O-acetyltransferase NeuD family)